MRFAVIDLGTNTFNLLIVEFDDNKKWKEIYSTKMSVKLGEGGIEKRLIQEFHQFLIVSLEEL